MTGSCDLCGLATDGDPVSGEGVNGQFCCRGCLEVSRAMDDVETASPGDVADRADGTDPGLEDGDAAESADCEETFLAIDGMHCSTCEAFLALRGESRDGILAVDANYATDTARVRYDPDRLDAAALPERLSGYGYTARFRDEESTTERAREGDEATLQRLLVGGFGALLAMPFYVFVLYPRYVGIESGILRVDMTTPLGLYLPMGIVALASALVVGYTGWPILRGAVVSLRARRPNMDLLLFVAILSAFAYSTLALATGSVHLYYDVAIAIVLVVTAGGYYEDRLKRQATGRLSQLTAMREREAHRCADDGTLETIPVEDLAAGDEIVVRPGERVPIDGTVCEGIAAVDEAVLTGESLPQTKRPGDDVVGGGVVTDEALVIRVAEGAQSTLDRITALLWAVQSQRPGVQRFADRLATVFVPLVLVLGGTVTAWRVATGEPASGALLAGLTVLVAACPCAMGLATPLAVAGGLRDALDRGIVVTSNAIFETAPDLETVVFDKTGTLTTGEMTVRSIVGDRESADAAAAIEQHSAHPVASAIVEDARTRADGGLADGAGADEAAADGTGADGTGTDEVDASPAAGENPLAATVTDVDRHPGAGVSGRVDGDRVVVGTPTLVQERTGSLPAELLDVVEEAQSAGDVPVVVGRENRAEAVVTVGDREREDWESVLSTLDEHRIVVLTGDDERAAASFREHPAVDDVFAGVPPDGKVATVQRLRADGPTAMVGDGTNDAPALSAADVGIAIAGTAAAGEAADVVLPDGRLRDVPAVFDLARATRRRIRENVGWALCYNAVALPLAALGVLNPLLAAVAMAGSSILVVTNSRRRLLDGGG
jgi:Cu2+-exporting ATPase